jgi:hypothetical protein
MTTAVIGATGRMALIDHRDAAEAGLRVPRSRSKACAGGSSPHTPRASRSAPAAVIGLVTQAGARTAVTAPATQARRFAASITRGAHGWSRYALARTPRP